MMAVRGYVYLMASETQARRTAAWPPTSWKVAYSNSDRGDTRAATALRRAVTKTTMMRRARWPHCVCSRSILQPCFGDDGYLAPRPSSTGITRRTYTIGPTQLHIGCAVGELNRQTNRDVGIALPLNSATYPKKFKSLLHTSCLYGTCGPLLLALCKIGLSLLPLLCLQEMQYRWLQHYGGEANFCVAISQSGTHSLFVSSSTIVPTAKWLTQIFSKIYAW